MIRIFLLLLFITVPAIAADLALLEKTVIKRAEKDSVTAEEYFIRQIEKQPAPTTEEQAVYVLGMGIAAERQGKVVDALDYYAGAEALGSETARTKALRLQKQGYRSTMKRVFSGPSD